MSGGEKSGSQTACVRPALYGLYGLAVGVRAASDGRRYEGVGVAQQTFPALRSRDVAFRSAHGAHRCDARRSNVRRRRPDCWATGCCGSGHRNRERGHHQSGLVAKAFRAALAVHSGRHWLRQNCQAAWCSRGQLLRPCAAPRQGSADWRASEEELRCNLQLRCELAPTDESEPLVQRIGTVLLRCAARSSDRLSGESVDQRATTGSAGAARCECATGGRKKSTLATPHNNYSHKARYLPQLAGLHVAPLARAHTPAAPRTVARA